MDPRLLKSLQSPGMRFYQTSENSLAQYGQILFTELKQKAEDADTTDEALWYSDAACLVLELMIRLQAAQHEINKKEAINTRYMERGI